jgi:parallel beta-helix repeat protein
MLQKMHKSGQKKQRFVSFTISFVLLLNLVIIILPTFSPTASAYVHGTVGFESTADEDQGPNDANPALFQVRWDTSSTHYIEGDYTVSSGYPLTIDPSCNIVFNGSFSIIVESVLFAQGAPGNRITFSSNSTSPGPGNWTSIDFAGGGGTLEYCDIQYGTEAVHIDSVAAITINENNIINNVMGINGTHPSLSFSNNNVSNNSLSGIRIEGPSSGLTFSATGNTILGNQAGITLESQIGNIDTTITGNEISDSFYDGIYIYSSSGDITTTIDENTIERNGYEGIYIIPVGASATLDATISGNDIIMNNYGIWITNDWLFEGTSMIFNISSNNIIDNGDGIFIDGWCSVDAEIWNNNLTNNTFDPIYSITQTGNCNYRIRDNFIWKNIGAMDLEYWYTDPGNETPFFEITDNTIIENIGSGIYVWSDKNLDLTLANNDFIKNDYAFYSGTLNTQYAFIFDNYFNNNFGTGLELDTFDDISLQMTKNRVMNSTDDNFYLYTINGGDFDIRDNEFSGSANLNGVYIDYFNGSGIFSDNVLSNNDQSGIDFWEGSDITVINTTFSNNSYGLTGYSSFINITNSSIVFSLNDFNLYGDSHFTTLNTTFDNSTASFGDSYSDLTVKWFLDVHVVDNAGFGVDDADVFVNDSFDTNEWSGNTGSGNNGWVYLIPSSEYVENSTGKNYTSPHNVSAQKGQDFGREYPKVWQNRDVTIVLNSAPIVENIWPAGGAPANVLRGDTLFIHANASDLTDPENMLTPYFEYRDPSDLLWNTSLFSASATYIGSAPSGYWSIPLSPDLVYSELGWHDLRVRFQDTKGAFSNYIYEFNSVDVKNNLPEVLSLSSEMSTVYRGDSDIVYANFDDREEAEENLLPVFEYSSSSGATWETSYLGLPVYNNGQSRWEITFSPPTNAQIDFYDFRASVTDSDGGMSESIEVQDMVEVRNNIPFSTDISVSSSNVQRTQTIYIYSNANDVEDSEDSLTPNFEFKKPGESIWIADYLSNAIYTAGEWRVDFTPPFDAPTGLYDLRVRFSDPDGDFSQWIFDIGSVTVENNVPSVLDISTSEFEVARGNHIFLFANASDLETQEKDLRCEFEYRISGGLWQNISFSGKIFYQGHWQVQFSPDSEMTPGDYELRVGFYDPSGDFSDWLEISGTIAVINNPPTITAFDVDPSQIYRTESALIIAEVYDFEDFPSDLTVTFQYTPSGSINWKDLPGESYNSGENHFEVSFAPSDSFEVGDYDFRVQVTDSDNIDSSWLRLDEGLEVLNNAPSVIDISLSESEMFRGEEITIYSNGQDAEMDEDDLVPTFEYSSDTSTWETSYLGTPQYTSGQWQVPFTPPFSSDSGAYSFRVRFSDSDDDDSNWMYDYNALDVKNNLPSAEITTTGSQDDDTVSFSATVSDSEDSQSSLTFLWNFGDGETSSSQSPSHTYESSGTYTVTLTVTDKNGGEDIDTSEIEIESRTGVGPSGETQDAFPLWILLIVVVVIVVLILVLLMKRKKPSKEEVWPPEIQPQGNAPVQNVPPPPTVPLVPVSSSPPSPPTPQPALPPAPFGLEKEKAEFKKNIKCPKCKAAFQIPFKKGTQKVTCPHCGISGNINL